MDEEIIQDVPEQKRTEFREQINNAIQNPTNDIKQMIAWVGNTELKVQSQVVINGFTVEEARLFLEETRTALERAIDGGRYVGSNVVAELRPDKYLKDTQKIVDDL